MVRIHDEEPELEQVLNKGIKLTVGTMNYQNVYNLLIQKRIKNPLNKEDFEIGSIERHHIVPKSLGGDNSSSNLVNLTVREHFVAHRLLLNIYKHDKEKYNKMLFAMFAMMSLYGYVKSNSRKLVFVGGSRFYEKIRRKVQIELIKRHRLKWGKLTVEDKNRLNIKISKSLKQYYKSHRSIWCGRKHDEQTKNKLSEIAKKRPIELKCPSLGKKWVFNLDTRTNALVDKDFEVCGSWRNGRCFDIDGFIEKENIISEIKKLEPLFKSHKKQTKNFLVRKLNSLKERNNKENKKAAQNKKDKKRAVNIDSEKMLYYSNLFSVYKTNGFSGVVEKFGYKYSKVNLVNQFKRYVKEYVPNTNGQRNHSQH